MALQSENAMLKTRGTKDDFTPSVGELKDQKEKLKDTLKKVVFQFCEVCNINQDQGNRHKYFPTHRTRLSRILSKFDSKLVEFRNFLNNDSIPSSRTSLWCIFCDSDIHDSSAYLPENAINHLSSLEHRKKVKHFLWKHGKGESDNPNRFCLLESDVTKWISKRKSLKEYNENQIGPSNYIQTTLESVDSRYASKYPNRVFPLQHDTNECQAHSSAVHVEAKPPWLDGYKEKSVNLVAVKGPKLNPKRVGAAWAERRKMELEMEKRGEIPKRVYDPNWLPNFGRVWQSGSRKESLREFVEEKQNLPKGKQELEETDNVQPYISKRMKKDGGYG